MGFWEPLFFWIFALGALISSCAVIVFRNTLYCALALIVDFFFFAGLYVLLSAHFLAVIQILVYAGAIMVVFLFIIMLLNLRDEDMGGRKFSLHQVLAVLSAAALFFAVGGALLMVVDKDAVKTGREQAAIEQQAQDSLEDGEKKRDVLLATESRIPGLYADVNEAALEGGYRAQLAAYEQGTAKPSDGKYRPFDPNRPVVVPPSLRAPNPDNIGTVPGELEGRYGATQSVSVLLVNRFVLPFELTAVLLLSAIVGAMIIAKRRVA